MGPRDDLCGGRALVKRVWPLRSEATEKGSIRFVHQPLAGAEQSPVAFREISDHVRGVVLGVIGMDNPSETGADAEAPVGGALGVPEQAAPRQSAMLVVSQAEHLHC